MKTQIKTIACALLIATAPLFSAFATEQQQPAQKASLKTGMYFSKDGRLNVNIENSLNKAAKVLIRDKDNQVVLERKTMSHATLSTLKIEVADLPDGAYTVEVSNGRDRVTQNVQLETPKQERVLIVDK